jgi:hypothetical protein
MTCGSHGSALMKSEIVAKAVIVLWGALLLAILGILYSGNPELAAAVGSSANAMVASP